MAPILDGFNARVNRGLDLLRDLNDEVAAWQRQPLEYVNERSDDRTLYVCTLKFPNWPDMHRWAAIAGDALTNFRGSLDHLLRAFAMDDAGQDPPPKDRQLQFPICDTTAAFDDALRRHRLGDLTGNQPFVDAVRSVQPFSSMPIVGRLRDLDDLHKHRSLAIGAYNLESFDFAMQVRGEAEVRITEGPLEQEGMLFGVKFPRPTDIGDVNVRASVRLSFVDEPSPRAAMLQVIEDSRQAVLKIRDALLAAMALPPAT